MFPDLLHEYICSLIDSQQSQAYVYRQCRGQSQLPQTCQHVALSQPGRQPGIYIDLLTY